MIRTGELSNPAVRALVDAINSGDRRAFFQTLAEDATMSDAGAERDLRQWTDGEIFSSNGRMSVVAVRRRLSPVAGFRNDTWGEMRTAWRFAVTDGEISRFDTGQA